MHKHKWKRILEEEYQEVTIGIIGAGRIGGRVLRRIAPFGSPKVLVNDNNPELARQNIAPTLKLDWVDKETLYKNSDLISLHVPKTQLTENMITSKSLEC